MDLLCFCSVFCLLCLCARLFISALWSPAGKGLTSWLSFVVSTVSLSLSHWYPGSGVVLDCIDSRSLHPYLLWYSRKTSEVTAFEKNVIENIALTLFNIFSLDYNIPILVFTPLSVGILGIISSINFIQGVEGSKPVKIWLFFILVQNFFTWGSFYKMPQLTKESTFGLPNVYSMVIIET